MIEKRVQIQVSRMHPEIGSGDIKKSSVDSWVKIGDGCKFDLTADIVIEPDVEISDDVRIWTHRHNWRHSRGARRDIQVVTAHELRIGRDAFIGTGAYLIGVEEIGEGAVIGAGAVVRVRKVKPFEIWTGNPARMTGIRKDEKGLF